MNNIGNNIRNQRTKKDMTQQSLADQLYVTRQCVSRWEQGQTLPDIKSIEKIATILECSINDLIDDNSVKSIAIEQAISNRRKIRSLWMALIGSAAIIILTVIGIWLFENNRATPFSFTIYFAYGYVESIDDGEETFKIDYIINKSDFPDNISFNSVSTILDNKGDRIEEGELKENDKIKISFNLESNLYGINVMDSKLEESLYGVYISGTGTEYTSLDMIKSTPSGVNYLTSDHKSEQSLLAGYFESKVVQDEYFHGQVYDIYISLSPIYSSQDFQIGLITSNGVRVHELLDLGNLNDVYTVRGEYALDTTAYVFESLSQLPVNNHADFEYVDTLEVTYNIHINWVLPYTRMIIYEYDMNGLLISEETVTSLNELRNFEADASAVSCLAKVYTFNGNKEQAAVYELYLGERLEVNQMDSFGFVTAEWFLYQ
jgi:transcriptional regulator with XRE-family HTH domain